MDLGLEDGVNVMLGLVENFLALLFTLEREENTCLDDIGLVG